MSTVCDDVDRISLEFEDALQKKQPLDIEAWLKRVAQEQRGVLLQNLLAASLDHQTITGDEGTWIERFPRYKKDVREAFARYSGIECKPIKIGDRIEQYEIKELVGEGGCGAVYKAWDDELGRFVALKTPHSHRKVTRSWAARFCQEIRSLGRLSHPNILSIHHVVRNREGWPFMVIDYVPDPALENFITENQAAKESENEPALQAGNQVVNREASVEVVIETADALDYAHRQGIIHRDLKPSNLLRDTDGRVVVADFGLALLCDSQDEREGEVAGTIAYMSPEQIRGESHWLDGRSDIWSLGVILYQGLCGQLPFVGQRNDVAKAIVGRPAKPPRQINSAIPRELERICLKCLCKSPGDRYSTAGDVAKELRRFRDGNIARRLFAKVALALILCAATTTFLITRTKSDSVPFAFVNSGGHSTATSAGQSGERVALDPIDALEFGFEESIEPWIAVGSGTVMVSSDASTGESALSVSQRESHTDGVSLDLLQHTRLNSIYWMTARAKASQDSLPLQIQLQTSTQHGQEFPCFMCCRAGGEWTRFEGGFFSGDDKTTEMLAIARSNDGKSTHPFLLDDVVLTRMEAEHELVRWGAFETADIWHQTADPSTIEIIEAADGTRIANIRERQSYDSGIAVATELEKDVRYFVRVEVKVSEQSDGKEELRLQLKFDDSDNSRKAKRLGGRVVGSQRWQSLDIGFRSPECGFCKLSIVSDNHHTCDFSVRALSVLKIRPARKTVPR